MFNAFAAHLLMPRSSVLSIWDEFPARSPRLAAIAVAVRFSVSWTAACNQLKNLGLILVTRSAPVWCLRRSRGSAQHVRQVDWRG
jgi:Zn-dependent peptidase ImmA (M78 family)